MIANGRHMSRTAFAAILLVVAFALTVGPAVFPTTAQGPADNKLFVSVDQDRADLTPSQEEALAIIKAQSTTAETKLVKIRTDLLKFGPLVKLNIRANTQLAFVQTETRTIDGGYSWIGLPETPSDDAVLIVKGENVTGTVRVGNELFAVRPLGGGLHVIVKQAQEKFPPEHPPQFEQMQRAPVGEAVSPAVTADVSDAPKTLRILVAYTPKVAAANPDIASFINLAVTETNIGYTRSQVDLRAELAHAYQINYRESGDQDTDLNNFRNNSDSIMDEVHELRNTHKADVCVLLIDDSSFCGTAGAIMATENSAFVVVHYTCATGYYSFAHEIGHLQGARHNLEADGATNPFAFGHGYFNSAGKWRTIMSYNCPEGCTRVNNWSNPNVMYNGAPTGTAENHNNARVLNETAAIVVAFRN